MIRNLNNIPEFYVRLFESVLTHKTKQLVPDTNSQEFYNKKEELRDTVARGMLSRGMTLQTELNRVLKKLHSKKEFFDYVPPEEMLNMSRLHWPGIIKKYYYYCSLYEEQMTRRQQTRLIS